ncbi:peptidase S9 [Parafrankia soli]|uniref:Acyl-peptide hydrolase n=1 Tax=Parafrankia soli TaxID=2599596 RepID=A0A1S1PGH8_9ACTN|nr:prolyl oligopeptidase family serine peptidase [Parafrankia soli]OHV20209.1 peptidase S9 [Parafrankia soli]
MIRPVESALTGIPSRTAAARSETTAAPAGALPAGAVPVQPVDSPVLGAAEPPLPAPRDLVDEWAAPPSVRGPSPGPDGSIAFVGDATGRPALWVRAADGTERVLDTGPAHVRSALWSPDGAWIAITVAPGGGEHTEVHLVRPDGTACPDGTAAHRLAGGVRPGTAGAVEACAATVSRWAAGGRLLVVTESARSGLTHAVAVDPAGHRRHLAVGLALQVCAVHETADRWLLLLREGPRGARRVLVARVDAPDPLAPAAAPLEAFPLNDEMAGGAAGSGGTAGGIATEAFEVAGGTATAVSGTFAADASRALLACDLGRERPGLLEVPLDPHGRPGPTRLLAGRDDADLERFLLLAPATAVLGWNVGGRTELAVHSLDDGTSQALPPLPREVVTGLLPGPGGASLLLALDGSTAPGEVWTCDLTGTAADIPPGTASDAPDGTSAGTSDSGVPAYRCLVSHTPTAYPTVEITAVAASGTHTAGPGPAGAPEVPGGTEDVGYRFVRPIARRFLAHDGLELTGWWYRPRVAPGPVPTLLYFHGGPEAQERPVLNPLFHALLARGIAVFAPNVRGSTGFGRSFEEADHLAGRFAGIADVASAVTHLVTEGLAAPGHIGVAGRSYGGYLTLAALVCHPELFAVGVDVCGMADLETFYRHTEPWIAAPAVTKYGDPATDRDLLRALSPLHRMDALAAPLLVVHGANDTNVPVCEAEQTVAAARARGIPCEYLLFEGEGHEVAERANRLVFVRAVVEFVAARLTGAQTPADTLGEAVRPIEAV